MRESKWEILIIIECQIVERSERKMGDMKHKTNWWENWRFCYNSASWYTNNSQVHEFRQIEVWEACMSQLYASWLDNYDAQTLGHNAQSIF
jgi:hypothetical protein